MLKRSSFLLASAFAVTVATPVFADAVSVQDARAAIRDYAASTCGAQLEAVNAVMAETARTSSLDSDVVLAKELGAWTHEWPLSDETKKAAAFLSVMQSQALETEMLVSFVNHYADSKDAGDLAATRYQAQATGAITELAQCLRPTHNLTNVAERIAADLEQVMLNAGCTKRLNAVEVYSTAVMTDPNSNWAAASSHAGSGLSATCANGV